MRKQQPLVKGIITVVLLLFLASALVLGARLLRAETEKHEQQTNPAGAQTAQNAPAAGAQETMDTLAKAPFLLKITHSALSGTDYTSFAIYDTGGGGEELIFVCGRQYPSDTVSDIRWDADGYDITVTLRSGAQIHHCFDGSNTSWQ